MTARRNRSRRRDLCSRRGFLRLSALFAGGVVLVPLALPGCSGDSSNNVGRSSNRGDPKANTAPTPGKTTGHLGFAVGGGQWGQPDLTYGLSVINLDLKNLPPEPIAMEFLGHGFSPNPLKPKTVIVFEKHGKGCCEVDLVKREVLRVIKTVDENEFYGHGAFNKDATLLYAAETVVGDDSYRGVLVVRDASSHERLGEMPTGGIAPHDCILIENGKTLVITNGGGSHGSDDLPSVTYVDIQSRKVKQTLNFSSDRINAGHIWVTSRGELAIVSAPREGLNVKDADVYGAVSFYTPGDARPRTIDDPIIRKMRAETLSVIIHEPTMTVGATSPAGNMVTFWDFKTGKLRKALTQFQAPRGISLTLDQKYYILTYDKLTHMILIDSKTLEPVEETKIETSYISGSHVLTYDLPA